MTLGISIVYGKPTKTPPGWLAFLKPLHTIVWLYMSTAFLFVSLVLYFLAKYGQLEKSFTDTENGFLIY